MSLKKKAKVKRYWQVRDAFSVGALEDATDGDGQRRRPKRRRDAALGHRLLQIVLADGAAGQSAVAKHSRTAPPQRHAEPPQVAPGSLDERYRIFHPTLLLFFFSSNNR